MKNLLLLIGCITLSGGTLFAQKFMARAAQVTFKASSPLEKINPVNNEASGILDAASGDVVFEVPIRAFKFEKALMEEHFNENYMESERYPKATFKGKIANAGTLNFDEPGSYTVTVDGELIIHGVSRKIIVPATISIQDWGLYVEADFKIKPTDFNIKIPALVSNKVAKIAEVTVSAKMKKNK